MDAPKVKKYPFIDEVGVMPNDAIIKKWAKFIGKIPKGGCWIPEWPLPKIVSSQEEFTKEFGTPFVMKELKDDADRVMKATWSVEAAEDLKAVDLLGLSSCIAPPICSTEELINAMSQQIAKEVDNQIIKDLIGRAQEAEEQVQEAKRKVKEKAERKRREAVWRGTFSIIGRRYLDPEEVRAEEEPDIITVERKVIVIVPDLPFGLGCRRILA